MSSPRPDAHGRVQLALGDGGGEEVFSTALSRALALQPLAEQLAAYSPIRSKESGEDSRRAGVTDAATPLFGASAGVNFALAAAAPLQPTTPHSMSGDGASSSLQVPNSPSINLTTAFTAEAWIKLNGSASGYQSVFERYGAPDPAGNNGGFALRLTPARRLEFIVLRSNQAGYGVNGATTVTADSWHHIAAVCSGTQLKVYLDGQLDGTLSVNHLPATGTAPLYVGSGNWGGGYVNGLLDEARITAGVVYAANFTPQMSLSAGSSTRGLWKFDGQSWVDASGNGNAGAPAGGATFSTDVPTLANNSVSFDGTGRVVVPSSPSLNIAGPVTVEGWFKVNSASNVGAIAGTQNGTGGYILISNSGMPQFYLTQAAGVNDHVIAYPPVVTAGQWHHMAGVSDGSQIRVYLDGVLVASKASTISPGATSTDFTIGGNFNGAWAMMAGLVDEVRVSQGALYASNFTPERRLSATSQTRGLWKFDGGSAQDSSGYGNHGTLVGGASYSADVPPQQTNQPPSVQITAPANSATYANDSTVNISASASDTDGTISKVEFYANGSKIGEDATAPYSFAWNNVFAGSYALTAKATDNANAATTSATVGVTVAQPSISVAATDASASEQGSEAGTFTFTRTGGTSAALAVSFTVAGTATAGSDYTALGASVTIPAGASSQVVNVTPIDDSIVDGSAETVVLTLASSSSYVAGTPSNATVQIADNDTHPPAAQITSPAGGAIFNAPASVTLTASASDSDGTVAKVEFFSGQTKIGEDATAPYSVAWSNVGAGSYSLTAVATDNSGATGTSAAVSVIINALPSASVTTPAGGAVFPAPASITINADASDGDGTITKVEFFRDGTKIGEDTSAPYSFAWNGVASGNYALTAIATDNRGAASAASAPVAVSVNSAPAVSLTAPSAGALVNAPANITLSASASDADGTITKVEFYQGSTKIGEDTSAPYSLDWPGVPSGAYSLRAKATDNAGASADSASVAVTVNGLPAVALTSPSNAAAYAVGSTVTLTATASDADGTVSKVEFFHGGELVCEDTSAPYNCPWSNLPVGGHALTAKATDDRGATAESAAVNVSVVDFTAARLDARSRTGSDDLFSRNFSWGVGLVSLPGRAGLDLDVSISYNSLAWARSGSSMLFDPDRGFPTPGFRLGFPVVHGPYTNSAAGGAEVYILVTPSGSRVELRRAGANSNLYESADSSYLQLIRVSTNILTLRPADGSQLTFTYLAGEYQCTRITDRHGNYITVAYTPFGRPAKITDTLSRDIDVNYDAFQNPVSITQVRTVGGQQQTHTWATFGYESRTVDVNFSGISGLSVFGAAANRQVPFLSQVGLADGTRFAFSYNNRGQVERVTRSAKDASGQWVELSYVSHALAPSDADVSRCTARTLWAKGWNNDQPVTTAYSTEGDTQVITLADGTQEKVTYATAGFRRGLVTATETWGWSGGSFAKRRWTSTQWTQDDESLGYPLHPRVTESVVSDSGSSRRTTVEYLAAAASPFRLPRKVSEFAGTDAIPLRYTETDYELGVDYVSARIIGLVREQRLYEGAGQLQSRVEYLFDQPSCVEFTGEPVRHDAGFGVSTKRGLVCSVRRHNTGAVNADNPAFVESKITYSTAGVLLASVDPLGHRTTFSHADRFSDSVNRNTFAYPTATTDADQNSLPEAQRLSTTLTYDFDTGAVVRERGVKGDEIVVEYDSAVRPLRSTRRDSVNNADAGYARWVYSPSQESIQTFVQVDANVEAFSVQVLDGAGRVRATASAHPNSAGGYAGQIVEFDALGRAVKSYNRIEVTSTWIAAGDDALPQGHGWVFAAQTHDWKGRPLVTTNVDGTQQSASYEGCGCAGGEVVTLTDEVLRRQRVYHDPLGRARKLEVLNPDGSIYSSATRAYNARDQITRERVYQGAAPAQEPPGEDADPQTLPNYRTTTFEYDGHGRPWKRKLATQSNPSVLTYQADDTLRVEQDARGATATFTRNNRHLVTGVSYAAPSPIIVPPPVAYTFDAAGNRTSMSDGTGSASYAYNTLSQMTSETRQFDGLAGSRTIAYEYTVSGKLKTVSEQGVASVQYDYDPAGRLEDVTGAGLGASQFAADLRYRAWGSLKSAAYGDATTVSVSHDARGLPASYAVAGVKDEAGQPVAEGAEFQHYADGRLKFVADLRTRGGTAAGLHDRAFAYDHAGRLKEAYSGAEARDFLSNVNSGVADGGFRQSYSYDVWGSLTARTGRLWGEPDNTAESYDTRGRNPLWEYDADGRLVSRNEPSPNGLAYQPLRNAFDAAGRVVQTTQTTSRPHQNPHVGGLMTVATSRAESHDGDGLLVKETTSTQVNGGAPLTGITFHLRSTVLGGRAVSTYDAAGARRESYVYAGGELLAQQEALPDGTRQLVWRHANPLTGDEVGTNSAGKTTGRTTLDPVGVDLGDSDPFADGADPAPEGGMSQSSIEARAMQIVPGFGGPQVMVDGFVTSPALAEALLSGGGGVDGPENVVRSNGRGGYEVFVATAQWSGWLAPGLTPSDDLLPRGDRPGLISGLQRNDGSQARTPTPRGKFPCPPTGEQLINDPLVKKGFKAANELARSDKRRGFVETGGWVLMDRNRNLSVYIKPPEREDNSGLINGLGEPWKYIPDYTTGDKIVVADFHTHNVEKRNPDEVSTARARGTPGIWVYPSGKAEAYGPNRGLRGRALPDGCK